MNTKLSGRYRRLAGSFTRLNVTPTQMATRGPSPAAASFPTRPIRECLRSIYQVGN
jgi:hypothetical protein